MSNIDAAIVGSLGGSYLRSYNYKPATRPFGTRGGILVLWNEDTVDLSNFVLGTFSLTATVLLKECQTTFLLTVVYGPTRDRAKQAFLQELRDTKPRNDSKWLLVGDFNIIYKALDKNNANLNLRQLRIFKETLNASSRRSHYKIVDIPGAMSKITRLWSNLIVSFVAQIRILPLRSTSSMRSRLRSHITAPSYYRDKEMRRALEPSVFRTTGFTFQVSSRSLLKPGL